MVQCLPRHLCQNQPVNSTLGEARKKTTKAIYRHSHYCLKFGNELFIYLDVEDMHDSEAALGTYYSVPSSGDKRTILKGRGQYFSPDEVEVFYLDTSR